MQCVWLAWPTYQSLSSYDTREAIAEIALNLTTVVTVRVLVNPTEGGSDGQRREANQYLQKIQPRVPECQIERVLFVELQHTDIWMRDFGPIFVVDGADGDAPSLRVLQYRFTCWGYEDNLIDSTMFDEMVRDGTLPSRIATVLGLPCTELAMASEGGNREYGADGKTLMMNRGVELQRNPGRTLDELEPEYRRAFCAVERIVWIDGMLAEDRHAFLGPFEAVAPMPAGFASPSDVYTGAATGGHIDETVRFCPLSDSACLMSSGGDEGEANAIERETQRSMAACRQALEQQHKFDVHALPVPPCHYERVRRGEELYTFVANQNGGTGERAAAADEIVVIAAASYANFLVCNGMVLMATYECAQDAEAEEVIARCHPGYKIRKISKRSVLALNYGGGGIHCVTQQMPRV